MESLNLRPAKRGLHRNVHVLHRMEQLAYSRPVSALASHAGAAFKLVEIHI